MSKDIRPRQDDYEDDGIYHVWSYCDVHRFTLVRMHDSHEKDRRLHEWVMETEFLPRGMKERLRFLWRMLRGYNNLVDVWLDRKAMKELRDAIDHELSREPKKIDVDVED